MYISRYLKLDCAYEMDQHLVNRSTIKIPIAATPVPTIIALEFLLQKFLPSSIAYLVSALISLAALERSCLS